MNLAIIRTRAKSGVSAPQVLVETHLSNGLPGLSIVGLPETAVKESKDRVRSAILNSGFEFPARRITINLAPADLPKDGGRFDLPIALGILAASGQIPLERLEGLEFLGELALSGALRPVSGVLPAAIQCQRAGRGLLLPRRNLAEAALVSDIRLYTAPNLLEVCSLLMGEAPMEPYVPAPAENLEQASYGPDMADIKGQFQARRALEVAAAGSHNILFYGPPGTGKTMLASRLPGILPPMTEEEALEAAAVASVAGMDVNADTWRRRRFRAPHHTASAVALVGGGTHPQPGEISLAHHGVLFMDEFPEFDRKVLEVLREPLESGEISIARAASRISLPARFQLVAAMNPCPCGYQGHPRIQCTDTLHQVQRYRQKISGPLLDRIDLHVEVPAVTAQDLQTAPEGESSAQVRERVIQARERQQARQGKPNQYLSSRELDAYCRLGAAEQRLLENALNRLALSARAYHRIIRVARTLADLAGLEHPEGAQIMEALGFRSLDRKVTA